MMSDERKGAGCVLFVNDVSFNLYLAPLFALIPKFQNERQSPTAKIRKRQRRLRLVGRS